MGGALVAPWDVDDIPEDWLEALLFLNKKQTHQATRRGWSEGVMQQARRQHPTYRK